MKFTELDRDAPVSKKGTKKPIEGIRKTVVDNDRNFRIGTYEGHKRVAVYRNAIKVAVVQVEEDLSDEQILRDIKSEILAGTFDRQITEVYQKLYRARQNRKKAKKEEE